MTVITVDDHGSSRAPELANWRERLHMMPRRSQLPPQVFVGNQPMPIYAIIGHAGTLPDCRTFVRLPRCRPLALPSAPDGSAFDIAS
jgi:hypothetical protein